MPIPTPIEIFDKVLSRVTIWTVHGRIDGEYSIGRLKEILNETGSQVGFEILGESVRVYYDKVSRQYVVLGGGSGIKNRDLGDLLIQVYMSKMLRYSEKVDNLIRSQIQKNRLVTGS